MMLERENLLERSRAEEGHGITGPWSGDFQGFRGGSAGLPPGSLHSMALSPCCRRQSSVPQPPLPLLSASSPGSHDPERLWPSLTATCSPNELQISLLLFYFLALLHLKH